MYADYKRGLPTKADMSVLHLQTGSACPPLKPGVLRLYSMAYCPFAQRTRLALAQKNIEYELVNVHLKKKPEWLAEKNPLGLVPILEKDGKIVYESGICNEFLDDVYPGNKLSPTNPYEKAQMKMLMERVSGLAGGFFSVLRGGDLESLWKSCSILEETLTGDYFGGQTLNMVDIHVYPFFEKVEYVKDLRGVDPLPTDKFPKLCAWLKRIRQTEAVKNAGTNMEQYPGIMQAYKDNVMPDYDAGLKK